MTTSSESAQVPRSAGRSDTVPAGPDFATEAGKRLDAAFQNGEFRNLHAVVLTSNDELLLERYYQGEDECWGEPRGTVNFTPETTHDLRSISKSVVGLLYGIALSESWVPSPNEPLIKHLPQYADLADNPHLRQLTVAHALSMQLGFEWDEEIPYGDPRNSERAMEEAPDRCRFTLERPVVSKPGTQWKYSGGATALLARLITDSTGSSLLEYANARLFSPMGIEHVEWVTGHDGVELPASGLRMRPRDAAKLGQLVLNRGVYDGVQLVPRRWLDASFEPHACVDDNFDYGYQWWIARKWSWVAAFGNGGQRLTILPKFNLVITVTAGNYDSADAWKVPVGVLIDVVLPALEV